MALFLFFNIPVKPFIIIGDSLKGVNGAIHHNSINPRFCFLVYGFSNGFILFNLANIVFINCALKNMRKLCDLLCQVDVYCRNAAIKI